MPNGCKTAEMSTYNLPTSFIDKPSKIYPKRHFWFENIQSGNTALLQKTFSRSQNKLRQEFNVQLIRQKFRHKFLLQEQIHLPTYIVLHTQNSLDFFALASNKSLKRCLP
jgi:hypothetical protein